MLHIILISPRPDEISRNKLKIYNKLCSANKTSNIYTEKMYTCLRFPLTLQKLCPNVFIQCVKGQKLYTS